MKKCTNCGNEYPATAEFFIRNKVCKDGIAGKCKACNRAYMAAWKADNRARTAPRRRQLYAERHREAQAQKRRAALDRAPLMSRARILRQGMIDRARDLGLPFDAATLTTEWLRGRLTEGGCPCCDKPFDIGYKHDGRKNDRSPSVDRHRPAQGYVLDNVTVLCWRCNNLKRDATASELELVVKWMRSRGLE